MNKGIKVISYMFIIVFLGMMLYFGNYLIYEKDDYISSTYNSRLNSLSESVIRGNILSSNGDVLAETIIDKDGNEQRVYPYDNLFAHSVGYAVNSKTGLEAIGNFYMVTSHEGFFRKIYNNMSGNMHTGDNVVTSLNVKLQQTAYDALGDNKGACVVMEPDTGRILAMVSKPDFNPNTIQDDWAELVSDSSNSNLVNRVTRGLYPPGSTFKMLTTLEFMRENPDTFKDYIYECFGSNQITEDYEIRCYGSSAHGRLDLAYSFVHSCNSSYSNIGRSLNKTEFAKLCDSFLFNTTIPGSYGVGTSLFTVDETTTDTVLAQTAIGQGETVITPLHNALIAASIANGGIMMTPCVIDRIENCDGDVVNTFAPSMCAKVMTVDESQYLTEIMKLVVNKGTGQALVNSKYQVAGKTGSAQKGADLEKTHAWFVGFAPADDPEIVISIIVEEGGSGGLVAADIARRIFDVYFAAQQ